MLRLPREEAHCHRHFPDAELLNTVNEGHFQGALMGRCHQPQLQCTGKPFPAQFPVATFDRIQVESKQAKIQMGGWGQAGGKRALHQYSLVLCRPHLGEGQQHLGHTVAGFLHGLRGIVSGRGGRRLTPLK